ncbi:helix-turn-helix transcriptional regulator [Niallia sp. 03190]|uniref:helix-turn-helix transcriptional regulator n=1 Tax=Niallia sp. 03190 TaxID=3458061 RepID=UPI004045156B
MKNKIKFLRRSEEFDITQAELAKRLDVSRQTIIAIENGQVPSGELMYKICDYFGKDVREIFFIDGVVSNLQDNIKEA